MMETIGQNALSVSNVVIALPIYMLMTSSSFQVQQGCKVSLMYEQPFCHERQLSSNLPKTKVVTFGSEATCQAFLCAKATKWSK